MHRGAAVPMITRVSVLHSGGGGEATPAENDTLSIDIARDRRAGSLGIIRQSATACVIAFTWPIN